MTHPSAGAPGSRAWRLVHFDRGLQYLRGAVAAMIVVLLSFWSMVELSGFAPVDVDAIVLSVVVAVMMTRRDLGSGLRERAIDLGVLAVAAVAAALVGMASHSVDLLGEALFVLALGAFVWVRRFGARAARLGTIATLPFIATLITPLPIPIGGGFSLWALVAVAVAFGWATLVQWIRVRPAVAARVPAPVPSVAAETAAETETESTAIRTPLAPAPTRDDAIPQARPKRRLAPSTRMAVQLVVALAAAFLVGHILFPDHAVWPVITAFIVSAGNRGRGDVLYKGVLRVIGALGGTLVATLISGVALPGGPLAIVLIFLVLALALWLRPVSYAYWAACVTAALALLYGYFGQTGPGVLESRLLGVLWGGGLAIAAAWFLLPVKTTDVLRRRAGEALRALSVFTAAARESAPATAVEERRHAASRAIERVGEVAPALRALRSARTLLVDGRMTPRVLRSRAQRIGRIPAAGAAGAADLADLVTDASPELDRAVDSLRSGREGRPELQALGLRMRAIKAALEELRPPSG